MRNDFRVGDWVVHPDLNRISKGETTAPLEPKVMNVLAYLAEHPGEVLSREQIIRAIWPDTFVSDEVLTYAISELRRAFADDSKNPTIIQTIPRRGYRLIAAVWVGDQEQRQPTAEILPPVSSGAVVDTKQRGHMWIITLAGAFIILLTIASAVWIQRPDWFLGSSKASDAILAVLPFDNLSGDPEQDYFSDGLTEELITQLGSLEPSRLKVIARTSAMKYKGIRKGVDQIGRELGVNYILEGSVRREGERVRISAQLIEVKEQTHLWAESYDRAFSSILTIQNEVAMAVAQRTRITLSNRGKALLAGDRHVVPEAHEAYLHGRFFWNKRNPKDLNTAIEYFRNAIKKDPGYAPAFSGQADAYILLAEYADWAPTLAFGEAKAAAQKALEIDNGLAEAYASLGMIKYCYELDWEGAEKDFQRAIALNPSYATAHHWYANLLSSTGRFEDAKSEIERAVQIDTLSPVMRIALAWRVYAPTRQYDKALAEARAAIELDVHNEFGHRRLGDIYLLTGKFDEAIAEIQRGVPQSDPTPRALADLGHVFGATGRKADAQKILDQLLQLSKERHVDATRIALVYMGMGDKDHAMDWLERSYAQRDMGQVVIRSDPRFTVLKDHPLYRALLRKMRIPE